MAINKTPIFVAKTRNYDIFVVKIYDYALIDSFGGFPGFIDSLTSYAGYYLPAIDTIVTGMPNPTGPRSSTSGSRFTRADANAGKKSMGEDSDNFCKFSWEAAKYY